MPLRLSIGHLLAVVAFCGVGLAALAKPNDFWVACVTTSTLLLLCSFCLGAAFERGQRRASFAGAAFIGWGYMLFAFGPWFSDEVRPYLATTWIVENLPLRNSGVGILPCPTDDTIVTSALRSSLPLNGYQPWGSAAAGMIPASALDFRERIGHHISALIAALIGSIAARHFAIRGGASCRPMSRHSRRGSRGSK